MIRTFRLLRDTDPTGSSGTGHIADGTEYDDGTVVIHWRGEDASTVVWPSGLASAMRRHGHGGNTRIDWDNDNNAEAVARWLERLGPRLTARRRAADLTLRAAAEQIGVAANTLLRVEKGGDATLKSTIAILRWLDLEQQ